MQDAKWIWLSPEHFPQHQKGQATQFAPKGDFVIARFEKDVFRRKRDCRYRNFRRREISAVDKRNFNLDRSAVGGDYANAKPLGWCFLDSPTAQVKKSFPFQRHSNPSSFSISSFRAFNLLYKGILFPI